MSSQFEAEEGAGGGMVAALPAMLWHRRWLVIVPTVLMTAAGITAAFLIHPVYRSSATVLIESQQLPQDLIGTQGANDVIGERVARARERILSRMDLIRLIRTYDLYGEELKHQPLSKVVDKMRDATTIGAGDSSMNVGTSRAGVGAGTVAISVAFDYDDPAKAQQVAQQYVNRLLDLDASAQASQAADAVTFLSEQANSIQAQLAQVEGQISRIKAANGTVLALGQSTGDPTADLSRIDADIAGLRAESARLAASAGAGDTSGSGVAQAEAQLRVLQARYSDTHPDVIAAKAQVEAAKRAAASAPSGSSSVSAQLASNRAQLASLQSARALIASHSSSVAAAQSRAPLVAGQVDQLDKQADQLRLQYSTINSKLQAAQIQSRVESEQKGERLTLADPPVVPDSPIRPNRPVLILGSLVAGAAIGIGLIMLIELLTRPIRGTRALMEATGAAPLAIIPDFDSKPGLLVRLLERRTRRKLAKSA